MIAILGKRKLEFPHLTPRWTRLRPHPIQQAYASCQALEVACTSGRQSGKTEIAKRKLVASLPLPKPWSDPRYLFGGPTEGQTVRVAWNDLLALVPDRWILGGKHGRHVNHTTKTILCTFPYHQATLSVVGLKEAARVEGVAWDGAVLDENSDLDAGVLARSILPALAPRDGWVWRIGVRKRYGKGAADYFRFIEKCKAQGTHFVWPSKDIMTPTQIERLAQGMDEQDYLEMIEGQEVRAGGSLYFAFDPAYNVRPCPYRHDRPIVVASDFNVDPMAWVLGHRWLDRIEWFDEIYIRNTNTQSSLDYLWNQYGGHTAGWEFYGDPAGNQRRTSASVGVTDIIIISQDPRFQAAGRTMHYAKSSWAVKDRIASVNAMFCNAAHDHRMFIDGDMSSGEYRGSCPMLFRDLNVLGYKPGTSEPDEGDKNLGLGHISSAMGYAVVTLFPIRWYIPPEERAGVYTQADVGRFTSQLGLRTSPQRFD